MSLIQMHDQKTLVFVTEIMDNEAESRLAETRYDGKTKFMNSQKRCIFCACERTVDIATRTTEPLVGHHVKYFPPVVAWVHYKCHARIHNGEAPHLIQYEDRDSRKYYEEKKNSRQNPKGNSDILNQKEQQRSWNN